MARVHHNGPWGYEACAAIPQNLIVVLIAPKWGPQYLISCTSTQATTNIYNSQEDACTNAAIQPGAITMCLFSTPLYLPLLLLLMASTRVITSIVPDWSLLLFQNDKVKFCKQVVCSWNSVTSLTMTLPMSLLSCSVLKLKPLLLLEAHVANIWRILNGNTRSYPGHVWSPNGPPWGAESGLRALFISTTLQHHTTKTLELYNTRTLHLGQYQDCTIHTALHRRTNRGAKWKGATRPGHLTWVEEENDVGSFFTHHAFQETVTRSERGDIKRKNET